MLSAVIDSIDGPQARVVINDDVAIAIPVHELPPHARAGAVMRLRFTLDTAATAARDAKLKQMAGAE